MSLEADSVSAGQHKKHLRGWLTYAFASEVFVIVSLTLFLPICLEQFARDNGYILPDKLTRCSSKASNATDTDSRERCAVKLGWAWIDTASFSLYVYSISVFLQAITVISIGSIANHPTRRKTLLLGFALGGSLAAALFLVLPSTSPVWWASALLSIIANVGFGASVVAMNAYLPSLAKGEPEVCESFATMQELPTSSLAAVVTDPEALESYPSEGEEGSEPLFQSDVVQAKHEYDALLSSATSRISSHGIATGYAAGIIVLILTLVPVTKLGGSTWALRLAIGASGIWWFIGTIIAGLWLPGGEAEEEGAVRLATDLDGEEFVSVDTTAKGAVVWTEIIDAWKRLGRMLSWREVKRLRNTFRYLVAWFLLSDGFSTITSTAILFGKTTLHMPASSLILIGIITPFSGILGSLVVPVLQRRYHFTNLRILVTLVVIASAIPAYGCLGFLPVFRDGNVKFGGLTTPGEMFGLAVYFGSVYGSFQSYARAFYAELIPPGEEARWYGLFSITDKSSSFVGPLVVGVIADLTGNIRYAFFFLVFMIWVAVPILVGVDVERGGRDAKDYTYIEHRDGSMT
ncbi:MFS general substrate transporter [Gloeophyllum trabeum ATCC 11539]|uniref:Autophagy-related protein n=1 Tax=Gloeophyllum trabeum (strain ATCC 11539 / FP-39264 / Madison 617) TaxID=670483 RepID=S7Q070_GLOTA|nr:MFS general substrate transporter [Gloeophyllum trabeum ATCC 11539]EPQ53083.1 MFS general substrate transporter [Gloeophyllum trabeum ATCC 11539]